MVTTRCTRGADSERGVALVLALFMIVLVTLSLLLVAGHLQTRVDGFQMERRNVRLAALADAALAETLARLDEDRTFPGVEERQFGGGRIASTVVDYSGGGLTVTATGRLPGWRASIRAQVFIDRNGPRVLSWTGTQGPG